MAKYVVIEYAWEYDDENYSQPEDDPYNVCSKLYDTEEEAQKEAGKLNKKGKIETHGYNEDTDEYGDITIEPYGVLELDE